MSTIRVAIAGVGNCASSLVQGVEYYRDADPTETVPGLMHVVLGGYHVGDLEFVAAFDVDAAKVGTDLGKAIFAGQNNTIRFASVGELGSHRAAGPDPGRVRQVLPRDGRGVAGRAHRRRRRPPAVPGRRAGQLPAGGLGTGPALLRPGLPRRRRGVRQRHPGVHRLRPRVGPPVPPAGLPIVGDDIKSQVGSTIVHRILTRLFEDRGLALDHTYQLNVGGNMDFKNMLERDRLESKKVSKTQAVTSQIEHGALPADDVHIGPSDHVPWLHDRKWAYIRMEGRNFGDVPLNLELKLEVWDSPNSAGVIIDAVRCAKLALDRGIGGPLLGPSAYFMKSPPVQYHDDVAHDMVESFADGDRRPGLARGLNRPSSAARRRGPRQAWLRPPVAEALAGLLLAQRPLVEPELQQEGEGPTHVAPRARGRARP